MKRKLLWTGLLLCSLFLWTGQAFAVDLVTQRQIRQQHCIEQGRRSGTLTQRELKRLNREQQRIAMLQHKARQDNRITRNEARRIQNLQKQANRHIYQYKHNRANQPRVTHFRRYHHRDYRPAVRSRKHCRVEVHPRSTVSGILAQPGLSLAWNFGLH